MNGLRRAWPLYEPRRTGEIRGLPAGLGLCTVAQVNVPTESPISDAPHPLQVKAWREMGGAGRLALAAELGRKVRVWKRDALRGQNPTWSAERVERELAWIYLRGNT